MRFKYVLHLLQLFFLIALIPLLSYAQSSPKREIRGVWITTIGNIDWPTSASGTNVAKQKQELIHILDEHKRSGINTILFQIRPAADAFYAKGRESWSRYLTGKQGKAPEPFYDPLDFIIEECHKRGMELHAWINPYRASTTLNPNHFAEDHITKKKPEWFFTYAGKKLFNPGIPEVRQYIIDVVMDVVNNYDIDGVHFDDYFYPYPDSRNTAIPDRITFGQYANNFSNIDDWRRNNVDVLIRDLGVAIKAKKPYIKYGVSPCGIWDNKDENIEGSNTHGLSGYRTLFADGVKWVKEGWIDYINPQIYFPFQNRAAAYEVLVDWWQHHTYGRHFYIGHGAYRVNEKKSGWTDRSQIPRQIRFLREQKNVQGSIFFSSNSLTDNLAGLQDSLKYNLYRYPSLPPTMSWIDSIPPHAPFGLQLKVSDNKKINFLVWQKPDRAADGQSAYGYLIYRFKEGEKVDLNNTSKIIYITYNEDDLQYSDNDLTPHEEYYYFVTALDRMKNESEPSNIRSTTNQS
ncbi:family 10 glycosylhydrolase [Sphingobacterium sp. SRCM116780]|uniref:glycoside hydrolase family 10 protein n=1 Tax=Sphingobacterium sp. SRCM116780 TaxID=2907623 RepID=UPI001F168B95|nr:family 10 glycosylhydrolase [Sphingobacterium sp. SRCM116780]UIR56063.1 family 10 glycosylhydrolase [Sphingobacterium sp. SRCM116780]